jgi:hypothetical protein
VHTTRACNILRCVVHNVLRCFAINILENWVAEFQHCVDVTNPPYNYGTLSFSTSCAVDKQAAWGLQGCHVLTGGVFATSTQPWNCSALADGLQALEQIQQAECSAMLKAMDPPL